MIQQKKQQATEQGGLFCEACEHDFATRYPDIGVGFCEVHHRFQVSAGERVTSLEDLAILCSNCHRMIHRTKPMVSVEEFKRSYVKTQKT